MPAPCRSSISGGACVFSFLTTPEAKQGETKCDGPLMSGKFALPQDVKIETPASFMPPAYAALSGRWSGTLSDGYGVAGAATTPRGSKVPDIPGCSGRGNFLWFQDEIHMVNIT